MARQLDDLCIELHYDHDLAGGEVLPHLQEVLVQFAPAMASATEVYAYERDRARLVIDLNEPGSLQAAVVAKGAERGARYEALDRDNRMPAASDVSPRRFGDVLLTGQGLRGFLSVQYDSVIPARPAGSAWLWSNGVGASISSEKVGATRREAWAQQFVEAMSKAPGLLWGAAYLRGEFTGSNMDTSSGMRAIGRDVRTSLPGLYWLNVFGAPYIDIIGETALMNAPANELRRVRSNVVLRAFEPPEEWAESADVKRRLVHDLGEDFFFDRDNPTRPSRAPDFGLADLPEGPPFQVLTGDGQHFTPLPSD